MFECLEANILLNMFFTEYINKKYYIDYHPLIFNFKLYYEIAKKLSSYSNNDTRIVIGESFNKIALLILFLFRVK